MEHIEISPYHNQHIWLNKGKDTKLQGVLIDPMNHHETGKSDTVYTFIPTRNMVAWKEAEAKNDRAAMKTLEGEIDITDITEIGFVQN